MNLRKSTIVIAGAFVFSFPVFADEEGNALTRFIDNAEYELDTSVTGFFEDNIGPIADDDDVGFFVRFNAKSQTDITENISTGLDVYSAYSTQKHEYYGTFTEPENEARQPRFVDLNTVWLRYTADDYELMLGKDYVENGISELYSPVDRFGLANFANPTQPYKVGIWNAGLDYFIEDDTFSLNIMPFHEKSELPSKESRWLGTSGDADFTNISLPTGLGSTSLIKDRYQPIRLENLGYLMQYKGTRAGFDFFGLIHHGPSIYPVLRLDRDAGIVRVEKIEPLATSIAAGVTTVYERWKFSTEAIFQQTDGNKDDDFIRYSVGVSYRDNDIANAIGLNEINTAIQWSGDETVDKEDSRQTIISSREARPFRNTILLKVEMEHTHEWGYFISAIHNVEADFTIAYGAQYKPIDNLTLRLEGSFFDGPSDTHFGRWEENDFLRLRTIYKF